MEGLCHDRLILSIHTMSLIIIIIYFTLFYFQVRSCLLARKERHIMSPIIVNGKIDKLFLYSNSFFFFFFNHRRFKLGVKTFSKIIN